MYFSRNPPAQPSSASGRVKASTHSRSVLAFPRKMASIAALGKKVLSSAVLALQAALSAQRGNSSGAHWRVLARQKRRLRRSERPFPFSFARMEFPPFTPSIPSFPGDAENLSRTAALWRKRRGW